MSETDGRRVRAAKNQALFREVNERLRELNAAFDDPTEAAAVFVCECARVECTEQVELTLQEYAQVRSDPHRFFVAPSDDHVFPDVELVVERHDRYVVVEKIGAGAQVAEDMASD